MTAPLLALAVLAPLALLGVFAAARGDGPRLALPLASVPCAALALAPAGDLAAPWLLLGTSVRLDETARAVLLLTGVAWTAAAWFAAARQRERLRAFALFWLAALAGMVLAAVAGDIATFYTGYAAMTLAAYGLVVHERGAAAQHAARVYIVLALLGEALVLAGLFVVGARTGNAGLAALPGVLRGPEAPWAAALLLAGFAVKMGLVPLHVWLPVAHPVAPVAASAVLSGVLVKAGLLGALRLVPAAPFDGSAWPAALTLVGLATAFYGVAAGLCQAKLKTVLAYSTVSQMGLLAVALALALPGGADRGGPLVALMVLHHGLNKAALFLAAGSAAGTSRWRLALLALPALSLAGMPLTSGALAKGALKASLSGMPLGDAAPAVLGLASAATALLMLRVWVLARAEREPGAPVHPAWPLLVGAGLALPWWQAARSGALAWPDAGSLLDALWPLAAALAAAWGWRRLGWRAPALPAGDLLVVAEAAVAASSRAAQRLRRVVARPPREARLPLGSRAEAAMRRLETTLARLPAAGVALLALAGLVGWTLM